MSAAPWTVGRYVAETLLANGIDTAFGIPGVHNIELYRGVGAARLRHVLARHEQNATFAADGYARLSGRIAAALVISGPGLSNALTAIAQAYSDSVPLLVIASTPVRASLGKGWGVLHELTDQRALAAGAAGLALHANTPAEVAAHLEEAFAFLRRGRQRPVYLGIPLDLLAEPTALRPQRFAPAAPAPQPAAAALAAAQQLLAGARRPLIIAGGGARHAGAALATLLETLDAYLVTTVAGKGVVPEQHPANLGASLPYRATQELLAAADVVLAAGTELAETDIYTTTRITVPGRLIRIDIDPAMLIEAGDDGLHGDARLTLEALARGLAPRRGWRSAEGDAAAHRRRVEAQIAEHGAACLSAVRALAAAMPDNGVVFSDMTQVAYAGNYAYPANRSGSWFHPCGYGTLGFALPAAIGAAIAEPGRPVVALAGDFGVQFTLQELLTAVEHQLTVPIVVWNNEALAQIRDDMRAAGIEPLGVQARNPDFVAFAAACGARAERIEGPAALTAAVRAALRCPGPTLLDVRAAAF
ncbi:MAG TPA: 5-guanidino-2-oxopentanoate decarboxylase [Steroidobacteraceae bacterium]|jgi:5-guanidino-2-oxopentanoate decarboxylase|nr:5-guanidino-2-oxopentanoate decarboxylase [Steroidobacteraceae bacterium]